MARPAADAPLPDAADRGGWRAPWLARLLAPFPGRAAATTRIAAASTLTVLITAMYGTPEAAISAYVIFFINRADRTSSIVMSAAALVLVSIVIGLVTLLADFSVDNPMLRVACMAVVSAALLFLTSASKLRPIGAIIAMIVGFALDELGMVPGGELATRALLYAWLMVAIPIGANIVINLLIGAAPRRLACDRLAQCLRVAAQCLRDFDAHGAALDARLRDGVQPVAGWLTLARIEGNANAADLAALRQAAASTTAILLAVDAMRGQSQARPPASFTAPMAQTLDDMAAMLDAGGYPVDIALSLPDTATLSIAQQSAVDALRGAIVRYAEPDAASASPATEAAPAKRGGFLDADIFSNRAHVHYALKTTGAAMFCYLLYQQLNWPGIHTCFITCYLVSLGTAAETVEKLALRLAGCLVGAILGMAAIVYVVPSLSSVGGLLVLVFVGTWASAWVGQGSPRIAYAGFQIAFAFYLCVIQGAGPGFDLTIARDRVIGIVIGNLVVYLVFTRIWPVSIAARIDAAWAALSEQLLQWINTRQTQARRLHAASALALRGQIGEDLQLARYEPKSVGPSTTWVEDRQQRLRTLDTIAAPLFLLAERFPGDPTLAARVRSLTDADRPRPTEPASESITTTTASDPAPYAGSDAQMRNAWLTTIDRRLADRMARTASSSSHAHN